MGYGKKNKLHIVAVTALIRNGSGRYLVLRRSEKEIVHPGKYSLPGGKMEDNETVDEALSKEVFEETGLKMKPGKVPLKEASFVRPDGQSVKVFSYLVEVEQDSPVVIPPEFTEYRWISPEELQALPHVPIEPELARAEALIRSGADRSLLYTVSTKTD